MEKILAKAIQIAVNAHTGQTDRAGKPYIQHPLRVMSAVNTTEEKIVAILHDVIEDTGITARDLTNEGIPENLVNEVLALTHDPDVDYDAYVHKIAGYKIASKVKLADLKDNMDITRLGEISEKDIERLKKYHRNYIYLKSKQ
ncbi:HD domain-containing protein [Dysgonomonas sp. 521]|uniref:GTP pyrophosphokinase n=1 Tax=Dysgonomonas sp. 521 TaxID=2302932 RepID=UPI0013D5DA9C|nr:GTP pyrophosphokinase [Dysgonomonas sp. 521]NDV96305.1 HD domain-containing protein [Dysgonomonas sp. 521]